MSDFRVEKTSHTGVTVSDIDKSMAFYRDVLGFKVTDKNRYGGPFFEQVSGVEGINVDIAYVEAPGHTIELLCFANPKGQRSELRPYNPGFLHLAFEVENIDAIVDAVNQAGFEPVTPKAPTKPDGEGVGWRAVYTRDPDGVVLEFMEPPRE